MRKYFPYIIAFLFISLMILSFLIMVKPGARVFYLNSQLPSDALTQSKKALEHRFYPPGFLFDPESALITQDGDVLTKSLPNEPENGKPGTFAIVRINSDLYSLLFVPKDLNQSDTKNHTFEILFHPRFISSNSGGAVFLIISFCFFIFLATQGKSIYKNQHLNNFLATPLRWIDKFSKKTGIYAPIPETSRFALLKSAYSTTVLLSFLLVFMEWLFLVTKPSFMSYFGIK